jgi:hypothetical protein
VVVDSNYLGMAVSSNPILLRYRQVTTCWCYFSSLVLAPYHYRRYVKVTFFSITIDLRYLYSKVTYHHLIEITVNGWGYISGN